jgi:hypothetical protein
MSSDLRPARRVALMVAGFFGPVFALPLLLAPYRWARVFRWREEPETDVGLYFGRCLGAVATATCVQAVQAAREPRRHPLFFGWVELSAWLLALVHVRGMAERRQPWTENAEIAGWSLVALDARRARTRL